MADPPASFEQLYDRHLDEIYGYLAYRLAPDVEAAQDVCQDVFEAALHGFHEVRDPASFRGWLFQIARHKIADHYRAHAARDGFATIESSQADLRLDPPALADPDRIDRATIAAHVMRRLPAQYAELLEDKYLRGLSVNDLAQVRRQTAKAVESALARARDAFRRDYAALHAQEEAAR